MDRVEVLRSVNFGQRVAEDESEVLASYFVETDHWRRVFSGAVDIVRAQRLWKECHLFAVSDSY